MYPTRLNTRMAPFGTRLCVLIVIWAVLALFVAILPGHANENRDVIAARTVIVEQIEAFRRDDAPAAYAHAAPSIKAKFRNPALFLHVVRYGYPAVYRPTHYSFDTAATQADGRVMQPVRIEWQGGPPLTVVYLLGLQASGDWKIEGVVMTRDDRVRA